MKSVLHFMAMMLCLSVLSIGLNSCTNPLKGGDDTNWEADNSVGNTGIGVMTISPDDGLMIMTYRGVQTYATYSLDDDYITFYNPHGLFPYNSKTPYKYDLGCRKLTIGTYRFKRL